MTKRTGPDLIEATTGDRIIGTIGQRIELVRLPLVWARVGSRDVGRVSCGALVIEFSREHVTGHLAEVLEL